MATLPEICGSGIKLDGIRMSMGAGTASRGTFYSASTMPGQKLIVTNINANINVWSDTPRNKPPNRSDQCPAWYCIPRPCNLEVFTTSYNKSENMCLQLQYIEDYIQASHSRILGLGRICGFRAIPCVVVRASGSGIPIIR